MADSLQPTSRSDHYKLVGVKVTDKTLGSGPYTSDVELDYVGLKCVGKKIHQALFMQGETTAKVRQLKEQCHLLSQLRHPNIAMFLGLFFQQSPILVMEYIPYDLASCIEQYGELPNEVSYSVLHDVAVGLNYLHSHTPAIIHGELSASTILLTPNMRAKISYLGVSKILRLTQPEIQYMAKTSGTLAYMAPEIKTITVLQYDSSIDSYSYGILVIHIFTGKPPDLHPNTEPFNSNTHSETATGYEMLLNADNPLKELTLRCTNESPQMRPQPEELEIVLADTVKMFPATFINRIEMMIEITRNHRAKQNGNDKAILEEKVQHTKQVVRTQQQEIEKLIIENEIFRKQLDSDKELFSKVVKDLQQSLNSEQSSDTECLQEVAPDTQEVKHHDSKPITLPRKMINRALPRSPIQQRRKNTEKRPHLENVTVKMFGPKPIIPPRKNAPPKENQVSSTPLYMA